MLRYYFVTILVCSSIFLSAQNDEDMIRYSRTSVGGTSRFMATGGAFGAVGADLSVSAFNPAGLAVYRSGDLNFSGGLKVNRNTGVMHNASTSLASAAFLFNNFGVAGAWKSKTDAESRHVLAFSNTQTQNFSNSVRMSGYTRTQSIANDMLNQAEGRQLNELNNGYEGLAYDTYLLDYDYVDGRYFSILDVNRTVRQTRDIVTTGRVNELNFSYAYTHKDKFYFGASLGMPRLEYSSTTTHTELDELDSMQVTFITPTSYTSTYTTGLPKAYPDLLGFHEMSYEEYFRTTGNGINLKLGGIVRLTDMVRIGAYYHTPTVYNLTDRYSNTMIVAFDFDKNSPEQLIYPESEGIYKYQVITPGKVSVNAAFIIKKRALIGIDYETINYRTGSLASSVVSDFANINTDIARKYSSAHNLRIGGEVNIAPFQLRAGYVMNGSPFGDVFAGSYVRNTVSLGLGYRSPSNFYFDVVWAQTHSNETYYLFNTLDTNSDLKFQSSTVAVTVGLKFH